MVTRATLAAIAALALYASVGCNDEVPSNSQGGADGGSAGGGGAGGAGGGGGASGLDCSPRISTSDTTFNNQLLSVTLPTGLYVYMPLWSVMRSGDSAPTYLTADADSNGRRVSFQPTEPGTYTFTVQIDGSDPCTGSSSVTLSNPDGLSVLYRLRALPAPTDAVAPSDFPLTLYGGTAVDGHVLLLGSGIPLQAQLVGPSGPVAGEVRFIGVQVRDADTSTAADGSFSLALNATDVYTPLLIPRSPDLAPHLGTSGSGSSFFGQSFSVGAGALVTGSVSSGAGPLAGAAAVLRAGLYLPSGVGNSGSDGHFSLRAEPNASDTPYVLSLSADGWPTLKLDALTVGAAGLDLAVVYNVARDPVTPGPVRDSSGASLVGARVTIESSTELVNAATVGVSVSGGSAVMRSASGTVSRVLVSDADGNLPALLLPDGSYNVTIEPPTGSKDALTQLTVSVPGSWTLQSVPPQPLSGTVRDGQGAPVKLARVTANALLGLGAAPFTTTDENGHYALALGVGGADLHVEPPAAANLSDFTVRVTAGQTQVDVTLAPGLLVGGVIKGPNGPLSSVLVEALCWSCATPDAVLASSFTDSHGEYRLYLPDPGLRPPMSGNP